MMEDGRMKSIPAFIKGLGILILIFVSFSTTTKIDGMEVLLTTDLNSKQRDQYNEASVRLIMLDITLSGTYGYFNAHRDEVNPREALRRWDAGVRVRNADRFERKIVAGSWRHTYKGTTTKIDGMKVRLTTDLKSRQRDQYDEASVRLIMLDITLGGTYAYFSAHRG